MHRRMTRVLLALTAIAAVAALAACGGYMANNSQSSLTAKQAQTVAVGITDAPGDNVVNFTVTFNSITLITDGGTSVPLVSTPATIEVTHLAGTTFPLGHASVPQGTYTKAQVTISNPVVTILEDNGTTVTRTLPAGPTTLTVSINPPLVVGSTAMAVNFDLNVFGSVSIDAAGNVTFTPKLTESHNEMHEGDEDDFSGAVDHLAGTISGTTSGGFTIKVGSQSLTFSVNGSTKFDGVSGVGGLTSGMLVIVDAQTQPDGTLLATEVRVVLPPGGMEALELDGLVIGVTGSPATQLQLTAQHEEGSGMSVMSLVMASAMTTVNVNSSTKFTIDADGTDLTNLPFTPTFTSSTVHAGQRIEAQLPSPTAGSTPPTTITATGVQLDTQAINGTVSAITGNTFTLTLASNSVLTTSAHVTTVTVFKQPGTRVDGTLANGAKVTVRGLLFFDGGAFKLVAKRIELGDND